MKSLSDTFGGDSLSRWIRLRHMGVSSAGAENNVFCPFLIGQTIKEIPKSQLVSVWVTGICTQNSDNISVAEEGYLIDLCI